MEKAEYELQLVFFTLQITLKNISTQLLKKKGNKNDPIKFIFWL